MPKYDQPWPIKKGEPFPQKHHILPSSRGGGNHDQNILTGIPSDDHWCWHRLFGNLTPGEIMAVILRHLFKGGKYQPYQRSIGKRAPPAPTLTGDEIIFALLRLKVIPKNWKPSAELLAELKRRVGNQRES